MRNGAPRYAEDEANGTETQDKQKTKQTEKLSRYLAEKGLQPPSAQPEEAQQVQQAQHVTRRGRRRVRAGQCRGLFLAV